jgi:6-pyruvoyl-tetrahydropterin synthase
VLLVITIEIGGGPFVFSAAHAGLHNGEFEPLHGHTFSPTVILTGGMDETGMMTDFHDVKKALANVIAPLRRRTLMPAQLPGGSCVTEDGQVFIECGAKRYSLPKEDVALLSVANTTTEAIAAHLLDQLVPYVRDEPGVDLIELRLSEAPDTMATASVDLSADRGPAIAAGRRR